MDHVLRPYDDELCGHVVERDGGWAALTIFGAVLGEHPTRHEAERQVVADGLASLAERWTLRNRATGEDEIVCIQEASTVSVTVVVGYYPELGAPTRTISVEEILAGDWILQR